LAEWPQDGLPICTARYDQNKLQTALVDSSQAIIAWCDFRDTYSYIYAQKIDENGIVKWLSGGICVGPGIGYQYNPQIISDGSGGAIVAWEGSDNIVANRVSSDGTVMWGSYGIVVCSANRGQYYPQLTSDGVGGAIITWYDGRSQHTWDIFAQRIDANGNARWIPNGAAICVATGDQTYPSIVSDGSGGAILIWRDLRNGTIADIYAQRVDANGTVKWMTDGVPICAEPQSQEAPSIASDGLGGAIIAWSDFRNSNWDVFAQRIDADGAVKWVENGVPICATTGGGGWYPAVISCGLGQFIITWYDYRGGSSWDVFAQKIGPSGEIIWAENGIPICESISNQFNPQITTDGSGGAIVAWSDYRNGSNADVYAQGIDSSGVVKWMANGVPICTVRNSSEYYCRMISDGLGGAIIAWTDFRNGSNWDIYAQRVDAAGHTVVATFLRDYATTFIGAGIALTWTLSEVDLDTEFFVERSSALNGPFIERPSSEVKRDGLSFSFIDNDWEPGTSYWYRVRYRNGSEQRLLFETGHIRTPPLPLTLLQNRPNPFNPSTEIRYYLPGACNIVLAVYDISGALITRLAEGHQDKGYHTVSWDGRDRNRRCVSSGIYFCRLQAGKEKISRKMVIMR
jgi:hypothetical protein